LADDHEEILAEARLEVAGQSAASWLKEHEVGAAVIAETDIRSKLEMPAQLLGKKPAESRHGRRREPRRTAIIS
jgi:hypothetical protein